MSSCLFPMRLSRRRSIARSANITCASTASSCIARIGASAGSSASSRTPAMSPIARSTWCSWKGTSGRRRWSGWPARSKASWECREGGRFTGSRIPITTPTTARPRRAPAGQLALHGRGGMAVSDETIPVLARAARSLSIAACAECRRSSRVVARGSSEHIAISHATFRFAPGRCPARLRFWEAWLASK